MTTKPTLAVESISFQGTALFEGVTAAVTQIRDTLRNRPREKQVVEAARQLIHVIKRVTNLSVEVVITSDRSYDFCMLTPYLRNGQIFDTVEGEYFLASEAKNLHQKSLGDKGVVVRGVVDIRKNRVEGYFADLDFTLILPGPDLISPMLSDLEIGAIILHELGHAFTACEYVARTVTTNQVLADISRTYTDEPEKLGVVLARVSKEQDLTPKQQELLVQAKSPRITWCASTPSPMRSAAPSWG